MGEDSSKWTFFAIGASPTALVIILTLSDQSGWSPVTAFFCTTAYLLIGGVAALILYSNDEERKKITSPIISGIFSGIFASAVFTGISCTGVFS